MAQIKTLSTMYMRKNVGVMLLIYSSTFHMPSFVLKFTQMNSITNGHFVTPCDT